MDLTEEMVNPQQYWAIPVVKPTQDEEYMSDEHYFSDITDNLNKYPLADFKTWQKWS